MHKIFRYLKIPETMKACPRNFRHYETENFRRKNVIPPFSSIRLFESEDFLKNSKIPSRKFSALWDKKNSIENRDMPPLIHKFFFDTRKFPENRRVLFKAFRFGPVRQKSFGEKLW